MKKQDVYKLNGIEFYNGKIDSPIGMISPLLVNGNTKLGKDVWTFSTLPTCKMFNSSFLGHEVTIKGTCPCTCEGCYGTKGNYNFPSVRDSLALKTFLCYKYLDFVKCAIMAQIEADKIKLVRIHATGDFFSDAYIAMWQDIVKAFPNTVFWTYTKNKKAEEAFSGCHNANIVKSVVAGYGYNFGHCDYIMDLYKALKSNGKSVYICRCGIDKNQHCTNCKGCSKNDYVLFIEHSTEYKAEKDPLYNELKALIESQATA